MPLTTLALGPPSRLGALLEHFSVIKDPREPCKVAHPLAEVLLLVVCGTIADCDDYDHISAWGEAHLPFLREMLPLLPRRPGRAMADFADEPDRSRGVFGLFHRLGPRDMARPAGFRRHRWQNLPAQPCVNAGVIGSQCAGVKGSQFLC